MTLTMLGLNKSSAFFNFKARVATLTWSCSFKFSASCKINLGGIIGSSACNPTIISSSSNPKLATASDRRSVPDWCVLAVIHTCAPKSSATSATFSSSVATTTCDAPDSLARSYTCWIIGFPAISNKTFPGKRVESKRAGIITWKSINTLSCKWECECGWDAV